MNERPSLSAFHDMLERLFEGFLAVWPHIAGVLFALCAYLGAWFIYSGFVTFARDDINAPRRQTAMAVWRLIAGSLFSTFGIQLLTIQNTFYPETFNRDLIVTFDPDMLMSAVQNHTDNSPLPLVVRAGYVGVLMLLGLYGLIRANYILAHIADPNTGMGREYSGWRAFYYALGGFILLQSWRFLF
ncbi:MAG: hypothetical protein D6712_06100 [Chloroflexi bacterium]|nr:MAG: hypothetical protein D6712_06100 [Chloroflexota bacterium]